MVCGYVLCFVYFICFCSVFIVFLYNMGIVFCVIIVLVLIFFCKEDKEFGLKIFGKLVRYDEVRCFG